MDKVALDHCIREVSWILKVMIKLPLKVCNAVHAYLAQIVNFKYKRLVIGNCGKFSRAVYLFIYLFIYLDIIIHKGFPSL